MSYDSFDELNAAFQLAQTKWRQGNLLGAYDDLWQLFTYRLLHCELIDADLKVTQSLADLAGFLGEFQAADDLLCGAVGLYEQANSESSADYTRLRRIQLCLDIGNLHQAQDFLQGMAPRIGNINDIQFSSTGLLQWEAGCIWRDSDAEDRTVLFAELYLAMGRLLAALGQYGEALVALRRGLFHSQGEKVPDLAQQTVRPLKLAIASAFLEKGNFEDADTYLFHLQESLNQKEHPAYFIRWLELSGKLHLLWGNLGAGLKQFRQVQELCRQLRSQRAELRSNLNLAHILILLNQTSAAQEYLVDAQRDASTIGDRALFSRSELLLQLCHARSRSLVVGSPVELSVVEMRKKRHKNQIVAEVEARLDLSTQSPNYLTWFEDRALAFQWQLSNLDLKTASDLLQHIKQVFKSTDSHLIEVQIRMLEGIFTYYQGTDSNDISKINQAHQILEEVCLQLEEMGLKPDLWQVQRIVIWCRTRLNYPPLKIEALTASTNQLLEQITSSLTPEDQVFYLLNKWTADEEYIATEINQLQRLQQKFITSNFLLRPWLRLRLMRKLNALVEHIDRYKDTLAKRTIKADSAKVQILPPDSLWLHLLTHPKDRVTLTFLILPDRVLVVLTGRFLFDFHVISTTRLAVRNLVQRWYKTIEGINGSRQEMNLTAEGNHTLRDMNLTTEGINHTLRDMKVDDTDYKAQMTSVKQVGQEVADNLADILQLPQILKRIPKHIRALTIVPDDILHGFPFAAIRYKGKYLIEHSTLSIAYESKGGRVKPASTSPSKQALVIGISNGNNQFNSLLGVKKELKQVNQWLERRHINYLLLENSSAYKAAVIESISKATLLHIACHGTFEPNQPERSGLVLIDDSGQQEILSLKELSEINLMKLRHATLSSCWSADHFILPRRWIISLPETLWRSGTQSILGCLWEVDDKVAVSFMTSFYNYLDKFSRDEALRQTQLDCLNNRLSNCSVNTTNPLFWAGFNLYGDYAAF
ncbi:CHAT domain-containing protein [Scytonema sp. UIC 10036]|uniref:CHAT domain-containing tetratricopeptide repeat protein n=1 Tax=Scytonema sp. UIC 10036 TaxID=2304196 RepID=UPI0012DAE53F|nr:CHAT domain-containing protein [Scytonema sp. UIC 10036]MUG96089.1 CHAT domain-containing protein [Scytonema sp. UIC 10036]